MQLWNGEEKPNKCMINQNTKTCPTTENASIYKIFNKLLKILFTFLEHMWIKNQYVYVNVQLFWKFLQKKHNKVIIKQPKRNSKKNKKKERKKWIKKMKTMKKWRKTKNVISKEKNAIWFSFCFWS
jgi:predicted membrane protein